MGDKPPALNARQLGKVLTRFGWKRHTKQGKGGHIKWKRPRRDGGSDTTIIPNQSGNTLSRGTMRDILRQASLGWDGKARKGKGDFYEIRRSD